MTCAIATWGQVGGPTRDVKERHRVPATPDEMFRAIGYRPVFTPINPAASLFSGVKFELF